MIFDYLRSTHLEVTRAIYLEILAWATHTCERWRHLLEVVIKHLDHSIVWGSWLEDLWESLDHVDSFSHLLMGWWHHSWGMHLLYSLSSPHTWHLLLYLDHSWGSFGSWRVLRDLLHNLLYFPMVLTGLTTPSRCPTLLLLYCCSEFHPAVQTAEIRICCNVGPIPLTCKHLGTWMICSIFDC